LALKNRLLLDKAIMAARSAQTLLDNGDSDGACNRAYYAVFDAAKALLLHLKPEAEIESIRTHSGLIGAFGKYAVGSAIVAPDIGRLFNRLFEKRLVADYKRDTVAMADAAEAVKQAQQFVIEIEKLLTASN
jgi:uncharacterized protein (UPF0332 family)